MGRGSGVAMNCGVGHSRGLDPVLLWLWCGSAAVALIQPPSLGISICHTCGPKKKKKKDLFALKLFQVEQTHILK